jgi:hypothetical protein
MRNWKLIYGLFILFAVVSCRKSEVNTKNLGKQGRWNVTFMDIGTNSVASLPTLHFDESLDPEVFTKGSWTHDDNSSAGFKWRFNYFAGSFSILIDANIEQDPATKAFIQCTNLSGEYSIITEKSKLFEFESISSEGYGAIPVFIRIVPA